MVNVFQGIIGINGFSIVFSSVELSPLNVFRLSVLAFFPKRFSTMFGNFQAMKSKHQCCPGSQFHEVDIKRFRFGGLAVEMANVHPPDWSAPRPFNIHNQPPPPHLPGYIPQCIALWNLIFNITFHSVMYCGISYQILYLTVHI